MGYEAMNVALKAIEDVCAAGGDPTNRKAIRDAVIGIKGFEGALGTWSFNENGDITIPYFLVGQVQGGKFVQFGTYTP
jgi:branched-chain amino acid transport system substrate-binding protein